MLNITLKILFIIFLLSSNLVAVINSDVLTSYEMEDYLKEQLIYKKKVDDIIFKLNTKYRDKCSTQKKTMGLRLISKKEINKVLSAGGGAGLFNKVKKNNYKAYSNLIGDISNNQTRVLYTITSTDAEINGIEEGSEIISIDGKKSFNISNILNSSKKEIKLKINSSKGVNDMKIKLHESCDLNIYILSTLNKEISFFRSNNRLFITDGLLEYIKNDDELVMLISNEFYHYINNHASIQVKLMGISKKTSGGAGKILAPIGGIWLTAANYGSNLLQKIKFKYDKKKEDAADFASIQITKLLNYDPLLAKKFWERLVKEKPPLSYISNFRNVDSQKIRTIDNAVDYKIINFPNLKEYNMFKKKFR